MKSIKEIANELNVTPQSVYNRLKKSNISIDELKPIRRGKERVFDEKSEERIKQLFKKQVKQSNVSIETLNVENEQLKLKIKELEDIIDATENEKKEMRTQVTNLTEAVKAANIVAASAQQQLQLKSAKVPFFQRLFGKKEEG